MRNQNQFKLNEVETFTEKIDKSNIVYVIVV